MRGENDAIITLRLPKKLVESLDQIYPGFFGSVLGPRYANRSHLIRWALNAFVEEQRRLSGSRKQIGVTESGKRIMSGTIGW